MEALLSRRALHDSLVLMLRFSGKDQTYAQAVSGEVIQYLSRLTQAYVPEDDLSVTGLGELVAKTMSSSESVKEED